MPPLTFIIARSDAEDAARRTFEDAVIAALAAAKRGSVLAVPSLYALVEGDQGLDALKAVAGELVIASWLHPRAAYWVLYARGIRGGAASGEACDECVSSDNCFCGDRRIAAYNLAMFESPDAAARRLLTFASRRKSRSAEFRDLDGLSRSRWYPVIDYSKCLVCGQCHDFCLFGVYSTDDQNRPQVTEPENCKPGCAACARICPQGAIIFPLYAGDEGIAGAPGARPAAAPVLPESFLKTGQPCPVCGCACDCQRSVDGKAPPGKSVCPACGCICDSAKGPCACRPFRIPKTAQPARPEGQRDDLDDLIDELDKLDV